MILGDTISDSYTNTFVTKRLFRECLITFSVCCFFMYIKYCSLYFINSYYDSITIFLLLHKVCLTSHSGKTRHSVCFMLRTVYSFTTLYIRVRRSCNITSRIGYVISFFYFIVNKFNFSFLILTKIS